MNGFGMYEGKEFQNEQREKLLKYINIMIHGEEVEVMYAGMWVDALYQGMNPFRDQLDLHNQCLLSNSKYQSDKIFKILDMRHEENMKRKSGIAKLQVEQTNIDLVMTKEREKELEGKLEEFKKNRMGKR